MILGRYMLDLSCDGSHGEEPPKAHFIGTDFADTRRKAIREGWKLSQNELWVLCPACVKNKVNFSAVTA